MPTFNSFGARTSLEGGGRAIQYNVHAGACAPAGLHRRARAWWLSPRCATVSWQLGGDPNKVNPLQPSNSGICSSTTCGRSSGAATVV
jgi:hypothetical protein